MDFQRISFQEANPALVGAGVGQDLIANALKIYQQQMANQQAQKMNPLDLQSKLYANEIAKAQAKNADRLFAAEALSKEAYAKFYGSDATNKLAKINAQRAASGLPTYPIPGNASNDQGEQNQVNSPNENQSQIPSNDQSQTGTLSANQNMSAPMGSAPAPAPTPTQQAPEPQPHYNPMMIHGVETPQPTMEDNRAKYLGMPSNYDERKAVAKEQQLAQQKEYLNRVNNYNDEADGSVNEDRNLDIFKNAYDKSFYKGTALGWVPSSGVGARIPGMLSSILGPLGVSLPKDMSQEQIADNAKANLILNAFPKVKEAMGNNAKWAVADNKVAESLKLDRSMSDEAVAKLVPLMKAYNGRIRDRSDFYNFIGRIRPDLPVQMYDQIWRKFQENFPLTNGTAEGIKKYPTNTWKLYTSPQAINSIMINGNYKPSKKDLENLMIADEMQKRQQNPNAPTGSPAGTISSINASENVPENLGEKIKKTGLPGLAPVENLKKSLVNPSSKNTNIATNDLLNKLNSFKTPAEKAAWANSLSPEQQDQLEILVRGKK